MNQNNGYFKTLKWMRFCREGMTVSNDNVIPFSPAATGLQEEQQQALFSEAEYIKDKMR